MEREEALALVKEHVKTKNLIKHMLAAEAIMRRLARHLGEDEEIWGLAGLLHDVDYEQTMDAPEKHAVIGAKLLESLQVDPAIVQAVLAHAEKGPRLSLMDKALYATDPLTGLLVAAALVHPDKKLGSLDKEFVLNRFREKNFARGADRDIILSCIDLGMELEEFISLGLEAMQGISQELGL
ncbi:MAG: HDIG domain-containing protein [Firmicutes bacterium]|nr:HDIG domain-containing protein [Bacillota bacterium]